CCRSQTRRTPRPPRPPPPPPPPKPPKWLPSFPEKRLIHDLKIPKEQPDCLGGTLPRTADAGGFHPVGRASPRGGAGQRKSPVGRTDRSGSPNARAGPPRGLQPQHRNIARHYWISWHFQSAATERLLRLPT